MYSSDELDLAEFGICLEEVSSDGQNIPDWNIMPQTLLQPQQVRWPQQQTQQTCLWNAAAVQTPVFLPNTHQQPCIQTNPQLRQYFQNYQFSETNSSTQQVQPSMCQQNSSNKTNFYRGTTQSHRAQITIVRNPSGPSKAIIKRKRKRTAFTTEQILALERVFCKKPYVNRDERQVLVEQLQVSDKAIKVWFQNRRIKNKREELEASSSSDFSPTAGTSDSTDSFGLAYVEAQMSQNTDEFGYVTLDDRAMEELVTVIDAMVADDIKLGVLNDEQLVNDVLRTHYEPISPEANSGYSEEDAPKWRPLEPEQSLRQLLDLQHIC